MNIHSLHSPLGKTGVGGTGGGGGVVRLAQRAASSSDPSEQSRSPSQCHVSKMQWPSSHWNCQSLQLCPSHSASSDLSGQSKSPSHFQVSGRHCPTPPLPGHWNSPALHCGFSGPQLTSSEPSWQSFSRSQRHLLEMHCPLLHLNWSLVQLASSQPRSSLPSPQSSSKSHFQYSGTH